jgi:hypothetical protein
MPIMNRHNWHERIAYSLTAISVAAGTLLGIRHDPDWLGRAGSVIICIGVLLAASRKVDRTEETIRKHLLQSRESMRPHIAGVIRDVSNREPTWAEVHFAEAEIESNVHDNITPVLKKQRRVLRVHEVTLVIAGTLINGFGPWLLRGSGRPSGYPTRPPTEPDVPN